MSQMSVEAFKTKENSLLKKAEQGNAEAYRLLGELYYKGISGNDKNSIKAYSFWIKAADMGDAIAAGTVGMRLFDGVYGEEKRADAFPYLKMAAKYSEKYGNATKPVVMLGDSYNKGIGCEVDKEKAKDCYERAALKNNAMAQFKYGLLLYSTDKDDPWYLRWLCCSHINGFPEATKLLNTLVNAPNPVCTKKDVEKSISSILDGGIFPYLGEYLNKQQFEEILKVNEDLAKDGFVLGMRLAGDCLRNGYGSEGNGKDEKQAINYYKSAAERGDGDSARKLGQCLIESDSSASFKYMSQAVAWKDPRARLILGVMYDCGIGCKQNPSKAIELLTPLALLNHAESQYQLSIALMDAKVEEKTVDDRTHNLELIYKSIHWLACAYINEYEDAINKAKETEIETSSVFTNRINLIKQYGIDPSLIDSKSDDNGNKKSSNHSFNAGNSTEGAFYSIESTLLTKAREGDIEAYRKLGDLYYNRGPVENYDYLDKTFSYWKQAAKAGDVIAAGKLGISLYGGKFGKNRHREAIPYLRFAADNGSNIDACHVLGLAYESGLGCDKNIPQAVKYYRKAALENIDDAQFRLAVLLPSTDLEYMHWLCCAALNGNTDAKNAMQEIIDSVPDKEAMVGVMNETIENIKKNGIAPPKVDYSGILKMGKNAEIVLAVCTAFFFIMGAASSNALWGFMGWICVFGMILWAVLYVYYDKKQM